MKKYWKTSGQIVTDRFLDSGLTYLATALAGVASATLFNLIRFSVFNSESYKKKENEGKAEIIDVAFAKNGCEVIEVKPE